MATRIPLPLGLLRPGDTLPDDLYDRSGKLLLRSGAPIDSAERIAQLEAAGFYDPQAGAWARAREARLGAAPRAGAYMPDRSGPALSARGELAGACARLQALFEGTSDDFEGAIRGIVATIVRCCTLDGDASLCCIHVPQPHAYNVRHPVNVAILLALLLLRQKHEESRLASALAAALTMNLGALDLHHELYYQAEAITHEQRLRIEAHPKAGVDALLARGVRDSLWLAIVLQHHEAIDGSGYPSALAAGDILPEAQWLSLADRYCAMVSERAQRDPLPPVQALREMHARHGKAIAPDGIGALVAVMGIYPPGSFVRLANGEVAVVAKRLKDPKAPVVYSLADAAGMALRPPRKRLVASKPQLAIAQTVERAAVKVPVPVDELWPPLHLAGGAAQGAAPAYP